MAEKEMLAVEKMTFEQAMQEMESIVEKMRAGELTLADSVAAYERGRALSVHCEKLLTQAAAVVQKLEAGELVDVKPQELRGE